MEDLEKPPAVEDPTAGVEPIEAGATIEDDPEPDREQDPDAHKLWRDRTRKRRKRAAATATAIAQDADDRNATPVEDPPTPSEPSAAQKSAARVPRGRGRPKGSRNKSTPVIPIEDAREKRRAQLEEQAAQLCSAMARGILSIIPPEYGGGNPDPDAETLGNAWAPVVAPMLLDAGEGTAPLYVAIGVSVQVVLVRAVTAYHARKVPAGYTVRGGGDPEPDRSSVARELDRERADIPDDKGGIPPKSGLVGGYSPED